MRPETLLMSFGSIGAPGAGEDQGANATKQGTNTSTFTPNTVISNVQASGVNNALILAVEVISPASAVRAISSVAGYADSWQRVSTQSYNFTLAGTSYNFLQEVWLGLKASAGAAASVTIALNGNINESVGYILKTFNNIDQSVPKDTNANAFKAAQNATTGNTSTALSLTSNVARGLAFSVIENPAEWVINNSSGWGQLTRTVTGPIVTNFMGVAWKSFTAALSAESITYGSRDLWEHNAGVLRQDGEILQPTTRPTFADYRLASGSSGSISTNAGATTSGQYCLVFIHTTKNGAAPDTVSAVTDTNSTVYTKLAGMTNTGVAAAQHNFEVWGGRIPTTNAGSNVNISFNGSNSGNRVAVASTFNNVNATTPVGGATGTYQNNSASNAGGGGSIVTPYDNSLLVVGTADVNSATGVGVGWTLWGQIQFGGAPAADQSQWRRDLESTGYTLAVEANSNWIALAIPLKGT